MRAGIEIEFLLGCDCRFSFENIQMTLEAPSTFCVGATPYQLVEFSNYGIPSTARSVLASFLQRRITPIITHPERIAKLAGNLELLRSFREMGCMIQITANALWGYWGDSVKRSALAMLGAGLVDVVATDAHDMVRRPPELNKAYDFIRRRYSEELADALCRATPGLIFGQQRVAECLSVA